MIKHHLSALLLALSPVWVSASVHADEVAQVDPVAAIDEKISTKQREIDAIASEIEKEKSTLQQIKDEQVLLQREGERLDSKRKNAKSALDKQYRLLLEDPNTDLATFQKQYQASWTAVKQNQTDKLANQQSISESEMRLSQIKQKQDRVKAELVNLNEGRIDARVKRLQAELIESAVLDTSFRTTCSSSMTLGQCSHQGQLLTRQKAVQTFKDKLIERLTESSFVKPNLNGVELNIHVLESQIMQSGFEGNNQYFTQLQAKLRTKPSELAACKLLGVSTRYCVQEVTETTHMKKDKSWANVTVRSDQYNDSVTINGINYGSTPVEVVLPAGRHQVTISKDGFQSYNREITINGNDTVWVKLKPN